MSRAISEPGAAYTVLSGDGALAAIALRLGVPVEQLLSMNQPRMPRLQRTSQLHVGTVLLVRGPMPPTVTAAASAASSGPRPRNRKRTLASGWQAVSSGGGVERCNV